MSKTNMSEIKKPVLYVKKSECCGCTACYNICKNNAISMKMDEEGFYYPYIDENKCVCCNQCIAVCSMKSTSK